MPTLRPSATDPCREQDAEEFFSVYLDALDEELLASHISINTHNPASAALNVEELIEGSKSGGQIEVVGKRDYTVRQSSIR